MEEWNPYKLSKASASMIRFPESFIEKINERIAQERYKHDCISVMYAMGFDEKFAEHIYLASIRWGHDPVEIATHIMRGKMKFEEFIEERANFEQWVKSTVYPSRMKERIP